MLQVWIDQQCWSPYVIKIILKFLLNVYDNQFCDVAFLINRSVFYNYTIQFDI